MTQGIQEQSRTLPPIEPESHLVQIGREMFRADLVPTSDDPALQERESRFDRIGVNVSIHVMAAAMIDGLVTLTPDAGFIHRKRVGAVVVCDHDFNVSADVLLDVLRQRTRLCVIGMEESQIATALPDTDYDLFVLSPATADTALLAAEVGFVHFDRTVEHGPIHFFHGCSDTVTEIPCRLIGAVVLAPDRALKLVGTHALLGFTKQEGGEKPLLQWQMGIIEDRASRDGELVVTVLAIEELFRSLKLDRWHLAAWTLRANGPAQAHKNFAALFVGVEQVYNVN